MRFAQPDLLTRLKSCEAWGRVWKTIQGSRSPGRLAVDSGGAGVTRSWGAGDRDDAGTGSGGAAVSGGLGASAQGISGAARGLIVSALAAETGRPVIAVAPDLEMARGIFEECASLLPPGAVALLPDRDLAPYESGPVSPQLAGLRLAALPGLMAMTSGVVVTTAAAWLEPLPPPDRLRTLEYEVAFAAVLDREAFLHRLAAAGYRRVDVVELAGEFAARGMIVDVYSPSLGRPVRIELDGDTVSTLRWFDAVTQRSLEDAERVTIGPAAEAVLSHDERMAILARLPDPLLRRGGQRVARLRERLESGASLEGEERYFPWLMPGFVRLDACLPGRALVVVVEPSRVREVHERIASRARAMHEELTRAREPVPDPGELCADPAKIRVALDRIVSLSLTEFADASGARAVPFAGRSASFGASEWEAFVRASLGWSRSGHQIWIACESDEERELLGKRMAVSGAGEPPAIRYLTGRWSEGCVVEAAGVVLLPARGVLGAPVRRAAPRRSPKVFRDVFADLKTGEPVVHEEYGIGLYRGVMALEIESVRQDFFLIEYADAQKLYLPADQAGRVQKYMGSAKSPPLSRLGTEAWERTKAKVAASLRLYAAELLKLYAQRAVTAARGFGSLAQAETEFARTFVWEETPDQSRVIAEVAADLERDRPMDRLVCGDVGYGKTEILIRAAFRVGMSGGQVAILVPTTVLAQQHWANLTARMAGTPLTVAQLSRFRGPEERRKTVAALAQGTVDIVVGTHHLLSAKVKYKSLGLLVVDEEHRFGVRQKEQIKELKKNVHVLTLTATPIPRTLNMGLAGLRDLSVIETPPPGRLAVLTHVHEENPAVAREAIRRELARGGQVFYLHNRVQSIMACATQVREMVPEARIVVAHGQMPPVPFDRAMSAFTSGKADVLVSTSIIGAGLDLPNANTLIVERAEMFGLADLYQIRGRIGRGTRQAYGYFFFSPKGAPTLDARRRLAALLEFGELGSGFRLAMRDLEIRGAGNLLGAEQHGALHAVGYDLFTRLLDGAVRELKGETAVEAIPPRFTLGVEAYLPMDWIPDSRSKLEVYKRLSACETRDELKALLAELADRFGTVPAPAARLAGLAELRILGVARRLVRAVRGGARITLTFQDRDALRSVLAAGSKKGWTTDGGELTIPTGTSHDAILDAVRSVLMGSTAGPVQAGGTVR